MKTYIGTKIVHATPMTRLAYNEYRCWDLPANENGADEGYLVEYTDGGAGNDSRHMGYISWSPKAQFDGAYVEVGDVGGMPPHQQRVVAEHAELTNRITKLLNLMRGDIYKSLHTEEQVLLSVQLEAMLLHSRALSRRINGFRKSRGD